MRSSVPTWPNSGKTSLSASRPPDAWYDSCITFRVCEIDAIASETELCSLPMIPTASRAMNEAAREVPAVVETAVSLSIKISSLPCSSDLSELSFSTASCDNSIVRRGRQDEQPLGGKSVQWRQRPFESRIPESAGTAFRSECLDAGIAGPDQQIIRRGCESWVESGARHMEVDCGDRAQAQSGREEE